MYLQYAGGMDRAMETDRNYYESAKKRRFLWVAFAGALVVLLSAAFMVAGGGYGPFELKIFRLVNNFPDGLRPFFVFATSLGTELVLIPVLLILWLLRRYRTALLVVIAGGAAYLSVKIIKEIVRRERPFVVLGDVQQRIVETGMAFPSGHTAFATAVSVLLALEFGGKWRWIAGLWISLVGLSRLYLGVHTPLDLVGAIALGVMVAIGVHLVMPLVRRKALAFWVAIRGRER